MAQNQESSLNAQSASSLPWYIICVNAIFRPSEATYLMIARDPRASIKRGLTRLFLTSWLSFSVFAPLGGARSITFALDRGAQLTLNFTDVLFILFFGSLVGAGLAAVFSFAFLVFTLAIQILARTWSGTGTRAQFVYTYATIMCPLILPAGLGALFPYLYLLWFLLVAASFPFGIVAFKAINQFGWGRALAIFVPAALVIVLLFLPALVNYVS